MKKILLIAILFVTCLCVSAQTTIETAIDLKIGENSYTFGSSGTNTAFFKYTAPADQDQLLTISKDGYDPSINVTDETGNVRIAGMTLNSGKQNVYPVKKSQTVIVGAQVYSSTSLTFNASVEAVDLQSGLSCDAPVVAEDGDQLFIQNIKDENNSTLPTYMSYTPTEDGILVFDFNNYVNSLTVKNSCDETSTSTIVVAQNYQTGNYSAKYDVEGGKNYIFLISAYSPLYATVNLTHPTLGSSCDMPFEASTTEANSLPKEAGTYWYQLIPEKDGYASISTEAALPGGTIKAYNTCSDYNPKAQVTGSMYLRTQVTKEQQLLICIEKVEATDVDETFNINMEDAKAGDSFANPIVLTTGTTTLPLYNGEYYYKLTTPADGGKILKVDATKAGITSPNTQVSLYVPENTYTPLTYGQTSLTYEAAAGKTYIVKWKLDEGKNGFDFNVSLDDIAPGETASNPIAAKIGNNDLAAGTTKYYTYTATKNGWLSIDTDPTIDVTFPIDPTSQYSNNYDKQTMGTVSRIQATANQKYYIVFKNVTEATIFTLSEDDYQQGESKDNPIVIEGSTTSLPAQALRNWYVYTADKSGKLTVKTDISYETDAQHNTPSVTVQINDGSPISISKYGGQEGSETTYEGAFNVNEGDKAYIYIKTLSAQKDRSLTCTIGDFAPGEDSSNPIPLKDEEVVTIPAASRQAPVWYSVELNPNDSLSFVSYTNEYFDGYLASASKPDSVLKRNEYKMDEQYNQTYFIGYKNEGRESTKFLVCITNTNNGAHATVKVDRAIIDGISTIQTDSHFTLSGGVLKGRDMKVYDIQGKLLHSGTTTEGISLPKGLYIVNGKKVVVR